MLRNNADARRCPYFELGLPVVSSARLAKRYLTTTRRSVSGSYVCHKWLFETYMAFFPFFLAWFPRADYSKVVVLEGEVALLLLSSFIFVCKTFCTLGDWPLHVFLYALTHHNCLRLSIYSAFFNFKTNNSSAWSNRLIIDLDCAGYHVHVLTRL